MDISAIVPCYNGERFIESALDSIAGQTVPVKEIIFVDDGSADSSVERAEQWGARNPAVPLSIVRQANGGVSVARNTGIEAAASKWIAFLDVDDLWYPDHNRILTKLAGAGECVLAFCDADRSQIEVDGERDLPTFFGMAGISDTISGVSPETRHSVGGPVHQKLLTGSFVPTCSNLASRSALRAVGGFEPGRAFGEDRQLWLKMFAQGNVMASTERAGRQRYHDANVTHSRNAIKELKAKIDLSDELLTNPSVYGLGRNEKAILQEYWDTVVGLLKYTISASGLDNMLAERESVRQIAGTGFSLKDWVRGAYRSVAGSSPEN